MFKFLKDKLKKTISRFSQKVKEELEEKPEEPTEEKPEEIEKPEEPVGTPEPKLIEKPEEKEPEEESPEVPDEKSEETEGPEAPEVKGPAVGSEEPVVEEPEPEPQVPEKEPEPIIEKTGETPEPVEDKPLERLEPEEGAEEPEPVKPKRFLGIFKKKEKPKVIKRISDTFVTKKLSSDKFDQLFWDLEVMLMENNVAMEVVEKIKDDLKDRLVDKPLRRGQLTEVISGSLAESLNGLFSVEPIDLVEKVKEKKPYVICFIGVNGSGKTTTIAKLTHYFKGKGLGCVLAAADTFRAASLEQLQIHADKLGVKLIKHDYGSDPAAVAFDAVEHAKAKDKDVVLIDTAGRQHSNTNLMDELKKVIKVAKPDLKIFVGDSLTGNDCVEQARNFNEAVGIDGIVLSKVDVDEKGGAAISVSYVTRKPIMFIGTGQEYPDLEPFESRRILESLGI
ncbi:MAG: signal recognition particle-docking protein FtsY [Nanoarchaeota archaeon]|nr:signal recognition particle-docking protein FtsY [Nanoarchaeota archaeon]